MTEKFITNLETYSVDNLIKQLKSKEDDEKLDLNPAYQRSVVWSDVMMSNFIDSIVRGIIPNNIIINKDKGNWTCMDGKQRLSSILKFYDNQIPYMISNSDNEDPTYVYFSKVPKNVVNDKCIVMSKDDRYESFLERKLPVAIYDKLSYENQADIFNRIQNSKTSTEGERVCSLFRDEEASNIFKQFCKDMDDKFVENKYNRDNHVMYILNIMYMIHNEKLSILTDKNKFIKSIDSKAKIDKVINKVRLLITQIFDKKIMLHPSIKNLKLTKNFVITMVYLINHKFDKNKLLDNSKDVIIVIKKTWLKWSVPTNKNKTSGTTGVLNQIEHIFDKYYESCINNKKQDKKMFKKVVKKKDKYDDDIQQKIKHE